MPKPEYFTPNTLYEGDPYDDDHPEFRYYLTPVYAAGFISDCWVCDKDLRILPGYDSCPIPFHISTLSGTVRENVEAPKPKRGGWLV